MLLKTGDAAPDFTLSSQSGKPVSLKDFTGKWLVLYFYPKDNTPGCTLQAISFRDEIDAFRELGAEVVGVSADDIESHKRFSSEYDLNFTILSDESNRTASQYGVWVEKKLFGRAYYGIERSTFLIAPDGGIAHIWRKANPKENIDQVIARLRGHKD